MKSNYVLTTELINEIKLSIKKSCSPRHMPKKVIQISDIPYTINGKKVELAVKQVIQNIEIKNKDSIVNPEILDDYKEIMELRT